MRARRLLSLVLLSVLLAACATRAPVSVHNVPVSADTPADMGAPTDILGENVVALSFSGGGLRAAAFAHGVLLALQDTSTPTGDVLDDLAFVSSVSGGSLAAAHFGLYGRAGLARFRDEVLLRDFEGGMRLSMLNPRNLARLLAGGLNERENFGATLDREIFRGATFGDLYRNRKVDIRIHATDLHQRFAFPFIPRVFAMLCSDLRRFPVADAVAASMAVPLVFAPVTLQAFPDQCVHPPLPALERIHADPHAPRLLKAMAQGLSAYRDPQRVRYVRLVDGGVTDNLGLSTLLLSRYVLGTPYAPITERDAVRVRRMLFIVVDASRGPVGDVALQLDGPGGVDVALEASDAATDAAARLAADAFARMLEDWRTALIRHRCSLTPQQVRALGGPPPAQWRCDDVSFALEFLGLERVPAPYREQILAIPTRLTLEPAQIEAAVEGGRRAALALPALQAFARGQRADPPQ